MILFKFNDLLPLFIFLILSQNCTTVYNLTDDAEHQWNISLSAVTLWHQKKILEIDF